MEQLRIPSYSQYLKTPLWESIRDRVFDAKGSICQCCQKRQAGAIHHQEYDYATLAGESIEHLFPICHRCHYRIEYGQSGKKALTFETVQRRFLKQRQLSTQLHLRLKSNVASDAPEGETLES